MVSITYQYAFEFLSCCYTLAWQSKASRLLSCCIALAMHHDSAQNKVMLGPAWHANAFTMANITDLPAQFISVDGIYVLC